MKTKNNKDGWSVAVQVVQNVPNILLKTLQIFQNKSVRFYVHGVIRISESLEAIFDSHNKMSFKFFRKVTRN